MTRKPFHIVAGCILNDKFVSLVHHGEDDTGALLMVNREGEPTPAGKLRLVCVGTAVEQGTGRLLILGRDGQCVAFSSSGAARLDVKPGSAPVMGGICSAGDAVYAYGMGPAIYRLRGDGWDDVSEGLRPDAPDRIDAAISTMRAVYSVCALGEQLFCSVGNGELHRRQNGGWTRMESPTQAPVRGMTGHSDGAIYGCGDEGLFVCDGVDWRRLEIAPSAPPTFDQITSYQDQLILSAGALFRLDADTITRLELDCRDGFYCEGFHNGAGRLLCLDEEQPFITTDGECFSEILGEQAASS